MTTPTIPFYPVTHDDGNDIISALSTIANARRMPSVLADPFNDLVDYGIGDYVLYESNLYRFIAPHSAGSWNSAHAVQVSMTHELKRIVQESAFDIVVSGDDYVLTWTGSEEICPYSVSLVGTDYILNFNY